LDKALKVDDLLTDPARYDGQLVAVTGWFVCEREHSALYPSPAAACSPRTGVWLVHPGSVCGQAAIAALHRGWVHAVGTFGNRRQSGCGHFSAWPAQLSGLSELRRVEQVIEKPA
jgi:hypothetical protein